MTLEVPYADMNKEACPKKLIQIIPVSTLVHSPSDTCKVHCHSSTPWPLGMIWAKFMNTLKWNTGTQIWEYYYLMD